MTAILIGFALIIGLVLIAWSLWAEYQGVKKGMEHDNQRRDDRIR